MAIDNLLQPTHLILVLAIALIVLGPKRLPEVGRSLGRGIREFKHAVAGHSADEPSAGEEPSPPAKPSAPGH